MRSLGLDIGRRRIGVSISDPLGISASPLEVLRDLDPEGLRRYVQEKAAQGQIGTVVVGLPLTLSGREGEQARVAREYAEALRGLRGVRVVLWDERLSTVEARRRLGEAGKPARGGADSEAAAIVLQSYLEHERATKAGERDIAGDENRERARPDEGIQ